MTESHEHTAPEEVAAAASPEAPHTIPIKGRFDQYRSSFWAAALAVIGIRYMPRPFLRKYWKESENFTHFDKNKYAMFAGLVMEGVTGFYAKRTWDDMKSILAEPMAWEFGKSKEDVTFADFKNSKNTIIKQTIDNYIKYNTRRALVNSTFFLPMLAYPFFKNKSWFKNMHVEDGVDFGVGSNALYLFSDVISRRITPFEELQTFTDQKINQSDHYSDRITGENLLNIYERHAAAGTVDSFVHYRGTEAWNDVLAMFERMADLMNQTHKNTAKRENADFSLSELIYLIGMGYLTPENLERNCAYIEVMNKGGVKELHEAQADFKHGATIEEVLEKFDVQTSYKRNRQGAVVPEDAVKPASPHSPHSMHTPQLVVPQAAGDDNEKSSRNLDKPDSSLPYHEKVMNQAPLNPQIMTM